MNALEHAVGTLARALEERRIPYMLIGGIANLVWGEPRATFDVDATVLVEETAWPALLQHLRRTFHVLPHKPMEFLRETHVLPMESGEGIRIDVLWARTPYEHQAIARATLEQVAGQQVRVCRPEDLIIHKIISNRPKDRDDVHAVIRHQGPRLDRRYLTKMVRELSKALDQPELLSFLTSCFPASKKSHA